MVFRRRRRNFSQNLQVIQSYKQISVDGPASRAAATTIVHTFVNGIDNYVGPTGTNNAVPTGAKIMSIIIFASFTNLVSISSLMHLNVQMRRGGIAGVTPGNVGGAAQRNTVIFTDMKFLGQNQNSNFIYRLKIPKMFQRIREGDSWEIRYQTDSVFASATQVIYKFYR